MPEIADESARPSQRTDALCTVDIRVIAGDGTEARGQSRDAQEAEQDGDDVYGCADAQGQSDHTRGSRGDLDGGGIGSGADSLDTTVVCDRLEAGVVDCDRSAMLGSVASLKSSGAISLLQLTRDEEIFIAYGALSLDRRISPVTSMFMNEALELMYIRRRCGASLLRQCFAASALLVATGLILFLDFAFLMSSPLLRPVACAQATAWALSAVACLSLALLYGTRNSRLQHEPQQAPLPSRLSCFAQMLCAGVVCLQLCLFLRPQALLWLTLTHAEQQDLDIAPWAFASRETCLFLSLGHVREHVDALPARLRASEHVRGCVRVVFAGYTASSSMIDSKGARGRALRHRTRELLQRQACRMREVVDTHACLAPTLMHACLPTCLHTRTCPRPRRCLL